MVEAQVTEETTFATKTEMDELRALVMTLAQMQARTDEHLVRVAETHRQTAELIQVLVEQQKETQRLLRKIAERQDRMQQQLDELAQRVDDLTVRMEQLTQRVDDLTVRMDQLTQRVELMSGQLISLAQRMDEMAVHMDRMSWEIRDMRSELGGLGRSVAYALENEAYRMLPSLLERRYGITLTERLIRTEIADQEINILGKGHRDGREVLVVGEVKVRLDERRRKYGGVEFSVFEQLRAKIGAVRSAYPNAEIVPLLVTHFARSRILEEAEKQGIIVIQSFEW